MYRIGLIIGNSAIFSNGLIQNAYFLYETFKKIGYLCTFLSYDKEYTQVKGLEAVPVKQISVKSSEFNTSDFDILLTVGIGISPDVYSSCKRTHTHVIGFVCGNMLANSISGFINKNADASSALIGKEACVDTLWLIEGHRYMKSFLETVRGSAVKLVRHVWSPILIQTFSESRKHTKLKYTHEHKPGSKYNIIILEPNIGYEKSAVIPFTICEYIHKKQKDFINQVTIFNWNDFSKTAKHLLNNFEVSGKTRIFKSLYIDEILSYFNSQTAPFIVISHQINNPWNYLYYELWNFGIPLVHNSPDFKHLGYYYSDCDVENGANAVLNAAQYHEKLHPLQHTKIKTLLDSMDPVTEDCQTYWRDLIEKEMFESTQNRIRGST